MARSRSPESPPEAEKKRYRLRADVNLSPCPPLDEHRIGLFDPTKTSVQALVKQGKLIAVDQESQPEAPTE